MSLAFTLRVEPPARLRTLVIALHLLAAVSLATAGALLFKGLEPPEWVAYAGFAVVAAAAYAAIAAVAARAGAAAVRGTLSVDESGLACWQGERDGSGALASALRWFSAFGLSWIELTAGGRRIMLVSGREQCGDRDWARLGRWLRWLDRRDGA